VNRGQSSDSRQGTEFRRIDLFAVCLANLINVVMSALFLARIVDLSWVQYALGIVAMAMGFTLGYVALRNRLDRRNGWDTYLLVPIVLFFVVELYLDYIAPSDFRHTSIAGPYVLLYFIGLWGLIGYSFRFSKKWGIVTLATYFLNMFLSVMQHL
jgi:hypothetical protein